MNGIGKILKTLLLLLLTLNMNRMNAQNNINANLSLNAQQQSIVSISALTAVGNILLPPMPFITSLKGCEWK